MIDPGIDVETKLDVDKNTLAGLGLEKVIVRSTVQNESLAILISELSQQKDLSHSWTFDNINPDLEILPQLIDLENKSRPTRFFFYYAITNKRKEVFVGTATVGDSISNKFPHIGIPILAKVCILNKFRSKRLYLPILKHRVEVCVQIWGHKLIGVQMASSNPRVFKSIRYNIFGIPFIYIGNEKVGENQNLRNFLWLTDHYKTQLQNEVFEISKIVTNEYENCYAQFVNLIFLMFVNQFDETSYSHLNFLIQSLPRNYMPVSLKPVLDLFVEIPLVASLEKYDNIFDEPISHMRL